MNSILDDHHILREGPPRQLTIFTSIKVVVGSFFFQFGSIFFWFGMIFCTVFISQSDLVYVFSIDGEWVQAEAKVSSIVSANAKVNNQQIYRYNFMYNVNGQTYENSSYAPSNSEIQEGQNVAIEYGSLNPNRARIVGMSSSVFPTGVAFILLFPLVGLIFMLIGLVNGIKALGLIRNGKFTTGKRISATPTNTKINNQTVFAYEFEFSTGTQKHIAKCKTHLRSKVEDEALEKILYNPKNPAQSVIYDAIATAPKIDKFGKLEQATALSALFYSLSTIIGLLVNLIILSFLI